VTRPERPSTATSGDGWVETGALPTGQPYARVGSGSRVVLSIPGLSFTHEPSTPKAVARLWRSWRDTIERHDLTFIEVGRRADAPAGSTPADIADDYATVIRQQWGRAVGVMGISTGGHYAQWLAIRHPELVERLVLGFTGHRVTAEALADQRRAVDHIVAGRWRSAYAIFGQWFMPQHRRLAGAAFWLLGPILAGRPSDVRVLQIDDRADQVHDATAQLARIRCPTLVISGGRDGIYPPELTREFVAGMPGARHLDYPKAGHGAGGSRFREDVCAFFAEDDDG
jgi:pimeloyl-ACP methyl ester carboxylesterase